MHLQKCIFLHRVGCNIPCYKLVLHLVLWSYLRLLNIENAILVLLWEYFVILRYM